MFDHIFTLRVCARGKAIGLSVIVIVVTPRVCARGKVIDRVVIVVMSTKIAISRDVGI